MHLLALVDPVDDTYSADLAAASLLSCSWPSPPRSSTTWREGVVAGQAILLG
ncbi:hypothetical protein ACWDG9_40805 [Streptomyces sp. NPDC001073]